MFISPQLEIFTHLKTKQETKMAFKLFQRLTLTVLVVVSASACTTTTKNFNAGTIPAYQPVEESTALSNKAKLVSLMDEQNLELSQQGPEYQRVKRIINQLSAKADIKQPLDVYVTDADEQVNAFAMGGNTIVVYSELLRRLPKDEELAVVLSHEVAHILGGHNGDTTIQKRSGVASVFGTIAQIAVLVATEGNQTAGDLAGASVSAVGNGMALSGQS